jgi:hypothetical protein
MFLCIATLLPCTCVCHRIGLKAPAAYRSQIVYTITQGMSIFPPQTHLSPSWKTPVPADFKSMTHGFFCPIYATEPIMISYTIKAHIELRMQSAIFKLI